MTPNRRTLLGLGAAALGGLGVWAFARRPGAQAETPAGGAFEVTKTDAEWRAQLTPEQYRVLRDHGTERAFTSPLNDEKRKASSIAPGATASCSRARPNTTAARAGRASTTICRARSGAAWTIPTS